MRHLHSREPCLDHPLIQREQADDREEKRSIMLQMRNKRIK